VTVLNHTSLFEVLLAGVPPNSFLWRMARYGVVPVASKTTERPILGKFYKLIAGNVVAISRERDHTWEAVLKSIDPRSMVVILPEGRMKRANGLDAYGRPLVVRGGIADILAATREGRWLSCYSLGLHHVQIPGQGLPKLFKTVRLRLEVIDVAAYCAALPADDPEAFRAGVIADLTERRDRYCTSDVGGEAEASRSYSETSSPTASKTS